MEAESAFVVTFAREVVVDGDGDFGCRRILRLMDVVEVDGDGHNTRSYYDAGNDWTVEKD